MPRRSGSVGERARARSEASAKEQAFAALSLARIAYMAAGFAMAGLAVWGMVTFGFAGVRARYFALLIIPLSYAVLSLMGARYVVHAPRTWMFVLGIAWLLPCASFVLTDAPISAAHAVGVLGAVVGFVSIFRVRKTLDEQPRVWDTMLAADAPGVAPRQGSVRRFQRIALVAGLAAVMVAGGHAWITGSARQKETRLALLKVAMLTARYDTCAAFRETWNGGDVRAIAAYFRPEVQGEIAKGLPAFVRGSGPEGGWPKLAPAFPMSQEASMTIDYRIGTGYSTFLQTDWEWRDDRWTLMRVDFGSYR